MRIYLFTFALLVFHLGLHAQGDCRVTASYTGTPLAKVFEDLEKMCSVRFAYDTYLLRNAKVTYECKDVNLSIALAQILSGEGLTGKYIAGTYVILPEAKPVGNEEEVKATSSLKRIVIKGEVRSLESNELLPFANLQLIGTTQGSSTDTEGKYRLELQGGSKDTLEVSSVGYESLFIPFSRLRSDSTHTFILSERKNYMPSILIESTRVRLVQSGQNTSQFVFNPNDMAIAQGLGESDIMRSAQLMPGINATNESSSGLSIRGSTSHQTLVQFDGFTLYHLDHFFGAFASLNTHAVKSIRVMKAAMDAEYGGRAGGMVEIIGKEGSNKKTSATIDVGSISLAGSLETPLNESRTASLILTGRRAYTDAIYSPVYKNLFNQTYSSALVRSNNNQTIQTFGTGNQPDYYFHDANAKLTYRPNSQQLFSFTAYTAKDQLAVTYADTSSAQALDIEDYIYYDESLWKTAGAGVRWNRDWKNSKTLSTQVGLSRYQTDFFSQDTLFNLSDGIIYNPFKTVKTALYDANVKSTFAFRTQKHSYLAGYQMNALRNTLSLGINAPAREEQTQRAQVHSLFIQDEWNIQDNWILKPGLRLNFFNADKNIYAEYRLNAIRKSNRGNVFWKMAAGRVHQFVQRIRQQSLYLNTPDYWQLAGTENLPVLITDQITSGILFKKGKLTVDAEAYLKFISGNTTFLGVYSGYTQQFTTDSLNAYGRVSGMGIAKGADIMVQYDAGRKHIWLSYSLLRAFTDYETLEYPRVTSSEEQRHEVKFYGEMETNRWDFSLLWVWASGRPYTPLLGSYVVELPDGQVRHIPQYGSTNSARLPAYHRMDVGISWRFVAGNARGKITASCFNVYNRANLRDRQYIAQRYGSGPDEYDISRYDVRMLGLVPSLSIQLKF